MCGIAGAFSVAGPQRRPLVRATLDAMVDAMAHRGPDDRGTFLTEGAAIGARRLSVIDVAGGHQPFSNEDGEIWAVQNGELYNHDALRADLASDGHRFRTRCDTEVLPHLYEAHGDSFVNRLRGMFAVAVWDSRRRRGILARDRLGIKPLYYAEREGLLLFASELKGLLASGQVEPEIDPTALEIYLTLGMVPAPLTLLRGVHKLPPGHRLVIHAGRVGVEQYWRYPAVAGRSRNADVRAYAPRLLEALREAVKLRLIADVPLGAMLSGGLDSSVVVALMAELTSAPVKTFAVGFAGSKASELPIARRVAEHFGTDHHELEVEDHGPGLDELVWHMDEPIVDLSALGFLALSGLARRHVTVALSGQGADELFAGYQHHLHGPLVRRWQRVPGVLASPLLGLAARGNARSRRFAEVAGARDGGERALAAKRVSDGRELSALLDRPGLEGSAALGAIKQLPGNDSPDPLAAALAVDAQLGLPEDMLHYFDRASMAHSLEVRVPFLDHHLVEEVASFPVDLKLHGRTTKFVLREAARGLVPDFVIDRPKVGFFNAGVTDWIARVIEHESVERILPDNPSYAAVISRRAVADLVADQRRAPTPRRAQLLLAIVLLETWLSSYLPRAVPSGRTHTTRSAEAG
jgi:asparagine synthase (glutamine-hydrolysing)